MNKRLLIVGIDPGATVGYAVLDLDYNLIRLASQKGGTLNELIFKVIELGDVIIVGTDKKQTPYFVSQFATKLGARVISPKKDLLVAEKRISVSAFATKNYHEIDALASALSAYNEIRDLINKIDKFIRIYGKEHIRDRLRKKVLLESISIKESAELIEGESQREIRKKITDDKGEDNANPVIEELRSKIRRYKNDIIQIKSYNKKLSEHITKLKAMLEDNTNNTALRQKGIDEKIKTLRYYNNQKTISLLKRLEQKDEIIYRLKSSTDKLNIMLSDIKNNVLIKKLPTLSYNDYELYNKVINIQEGDVLLVNNPNIYTPLTIDSLKDKVRIIFYKVPPRKGLHEELPFILIDANELEITEDMFYGLAGKSAFEALLKRINLLSRVIETYKKSRLQNFLIT